MKFAFKFGQFQFWRLIMRCHRCGGVMVFEKFYGICEEFSGWRCIFCGEIVDQVILENRLEQKR
jgi:hypothetical protein